MNGHGRNPTLAASALSRASGRTRVHSFPYKYPVFGRERHILSQLSKMVSCGVVALFVAVAVQAAHASICGCAVPPVVTCGCVEPPKPQFEEGCCPGPVIEKKYVTHKSVTVPYSYSVPTYSKRCYQQPAGVDKKVIPSAYETAPVCETSETVVKVPTTDVEVKQQPLCKRTCTTSEYLIQIPIVETTCTNTPLCKKTVKTQSNLLTTCARKTACAKQICTQNKIIETPLTQTVCQDYQGCINKVGARTVLKPEVRKSCVQLPPYRCLKPVSSDSVAIDTSYGGASYAGASYAGASYADASYPAVSYSGVPAYSGIYPAAAAAAYAEAQAAASNSAVAQIDAANAISAYNAGYPATIVGAEADAAAAASAAAQAEAAAASAIYSSPASYYSSPAPVYSSSPALCPCA